MSTPHQRTQPQRKRELTPDEIAARWVMWRRIVIFSTAGVALLYLAWAYLWPLLHPRVFPVKLPDEVGIEEVVAEFDANPAEATKKYDSKRIVVVGKLVVEPVKGTQPSSVYYQLPGDKGDEGRVPIEFFDVDDAGSVDSGDKVSLSGVMKYEGPGKVRLVGAGRMPE